MCGIAGFIEFNATPEAELVERVRRMTTSLAHRGPDDSGLWIDREHGVALGHRRLSIVDLSAEGHQPMASSSGRYHVVFNGEIYNYEGLRTELVDELRRLQKGKDCASRWRGRSDTEVLLEAIDAWGIENALVRFNGMFAIAVWDVVRKRLFLARDRFGEKPLYYGWAGSAFIFGSELKALQQYPKWDGRLRDAAIQAYMRHGYVPAPMSIYERIQKVVPGGLVAIDENRGVAESFFWSPRALLSGRSGTGDPTPGGVSGDVIEQRLAEAVKLRMNADVPLGAFLSGGVDSSLIVALMQKQSSSPVNTFSIGFSEHGYDEAVYAKAVARHLGTRHTELYVTPRDCLDVIPRLPTIYDEPFADSSQIPTILVSSMTRGYVTVALSGDGGDELFGGYNRYFWGRRIWNLMSCLPVASRNALSALLRGVRPAWIDNSFRVLSQVAPRLGRLSQPSEKLAKVAMLLRSGSLDEMYSRLISHYGSDGLLARSSNQADFDTPTIRDLGELSPVERMMFRDLVGYLPDDILVKVDRASMAVALEVRVPFLDPGIVELAWSLPLSQKVGQGVGKLCLREILRRYVPPELIERPKMGFAVPLAEWLRGPLRGWAEAHLSRESLSQDGVFDESLVRALWNAHLDGTKNAAYVLWNILMFQAWRTASRRQD